MDIKEIKNREVWDKFVASQDYSLFTQSWSHGEFLKSMGEDVWFFGIYEEGELVGGSLVTSVHAKRSNFLFLPNGPILDYKNIEQFKKFINFIKKFAKEKGYVFVRVSPFIDDTEESRNIFSNLGFRSAPMHMHAENTWLLDITPDKDRLLAEMNKNHRNLIRRCEREGVRVVADNTKEAVRDFNKLLDDTSKKHGFFRFSNKFVENQCKAMSEHGESLVFRAYLPTGELDASAVVFFYGNMAAYYHGASLGQNKKLPASYLLQWTAIQEAKKRGMHWYNFWGVAPKDAKKNHPYAGITHFKKGFGGLQKDLIHAVDLPLSPKYWLNWLIETARRIKRGF